MSEPWKTPERAPAMPCAIENPSLEPILGPDGEEILPSHVTSWAGFSARERAALDLRLPDSGTPWLDEMIAQARLLDIASACTAAMCTGRASIDVLDQAHATMDRVMGSFVGRFEPNPGSEVVDLTAHPIGQAERKMRVDGVAYRRLPEALRGPMESRSACGGCAFLRPSGGCELADYRMRTIEREAFGDVCSDAHVIYVRADE